MSEYQRYEFMVADRPLTRGELEEVRRLSSHIEASSSHAIIEYHWGNFKHHPIEVLRQFFDGFLYWANWGAPQLAFRFPRGVLPANLLDGYDLDDFATFTRHPECDILDIHFGEMTGPMGWVEYELGSLMPIREELMDGDLRALYIVWLASRSPAASGYYDDYDDNGDFGDIGQSSMHDRYDEEEEDETDETDELDESGELPVPPGFGTLTAAQQALTELLRVPSEMLKAAAHHSTKKAPRSTPADEDVADLIELLPEARRREYLARLTRDEPGLSRLLISELRALRPDSATDVSSSGERVSITQLRSESDEIRREIERAKREREERARQQRRQEVHDHQDMFWRQATDAADRGSGAGYDQATELLVEMRAVADDYDEMEAFESSFRDWVEPHLRRRSLIKRLHDNDFPLPDAR